MREGQQAELLSSIQATIGCECVEFQIRERKPNGFPDVSKYASVSLNVLRQYPVLPPVQFVPDYNYYCIAFWFPGYKRWIAFDCRSHQEQCSGPYEEDIDEKPYVLNDLQAPTHQQVAEELAQGELVKKVVNRTH